VVIEVDRADLSAELAGAMHGLKEGSNRYEVPAGSHQVVVRGKDGKTVGSYPVQVPPGGEAVVRVVTKGTLVIPAAAGRVVEIAGKAAPVKDGKVEAKIAAGKVPVVVKEPGRVGLSGEVEIVAGKTASIDPKLEAFDPGDKTWAWAGILGGGVMVVSAVLIETFVPATDWGGDATRWTLAGLGTAAFVVGTVHMKDILANENNPPVKPGRFDVRLSGGRRGGGASLALRF
jgi:hypothetical protein